MEKEIEEVWVQLGRDPKKLRIKYKSPEELEEILKKLKTIKYAFDLLFSPTPGVELAKEMIAVTFIKKKDGQNGGKDGHE